MTIKHIATTTLLAGALYLAAASNVSADVSCQPIYGGGQTCVQTGNIVVDKKVMHPQNTSQFVDNLGINDPKFGPESTVNFQIVVTNKGQATLQTVQVKDVLPQHVQFVSGGGNYDQNSRTLTFDVTDLKPNESRTFTITAKVVPSNQLPVDQGVVCVVNQAIATSNGQTAQDNAHMCIQKSAPPVQPQPQQPQKGGPVTQPQQPAQPGVTVVPGQPVTKGGQKVFPQPQVVQTPSTGPEMLPLIGLIPTGVLGYFLRRKSS